MWRGTCEYGVQYVPGSEILCCVHCYQMRDSLKKQTSSKVPALLYFHVLAEC